MPLLESIMPETMDSGMKSVGTVSTSKDDSDNFLFCDIEDTDSEEEESDSEEDDSEDEEEDSDDEEEDSDDEDEEDVKGAEQLLQQLQMRKAQNNFGSMGDLRGKSSQEVQQTFATRSVERIQRFQGVNKKPMAKTFSAADLTQLMSQLNPEQKTRRPVLRSNTSVLELSTMVGHIGQTTSAQKVEVDDGAIKPDEHLAKLLGGNPTFFSHNDDALEGFFLPNSEEYKSAWLEQLTRAVRDGDVKTLERMHRQGLPLQACNNFGESIIHLAVRRSTPEVLRFLLQDAGVSMRVRCDLGRSPVHDAAWCLASNEKSYQMMALLLNESPMQLLIKDNRGYTPLSYVPRAKWAECNEFLDRQYKKGRFASLMMG